MLIRASEIEEQANSMQHQVNKLEDLQKGLDKKLEDIKASGVASGTKQRAKFGAKNEDSSPRLNKRGTGKKGKISGSSQRLDDSASKISQSSSILNKIDEESPD